MIIIITTTSMKFKTGIHYGHNLLSLSVKPTASNILFFFDVIYKLTLKVEPTPINFILFFKKKWQVQLCQQLP